MEHLTQYCEDGERPRIVRGLSKDEVLVCYTDKEAAVNALMENLNSEDFPGVKTAPTCSERNYGKDKGSFIGN